MPADLIPSITIGIIGAGAAIIGAIIAFISSIGTQLIIAHSKHKSDRYLKKIEYLQEAQTALLAYVGQTFVFIPSFDEKEILQRSHDYSLKENHDAFMVTKFTKHYPELMKSYLSYRHYIRKPLRKKCDIYFSDLQNAITEAGDLNSHSITIEQKKNIIKNMHSLFGLLFLGILKALESISDQVTK